MGTSRQYVRAGSVVAAAALVVGGVVPVSASDAVIGQRAVASVDASVPSDAQLASATPLELLKAVIRCEDVGADQQYCLHIGFMSPRQTPEQVDAMLRKASTGPDSDDGVATLLGVAHRVATRPYDQRAVDEKAEIAAAVKQANGVAKTTRHVMSAATSSSMPTRLVLPMGLPEQDTNWYCGPASVAAVAYGHSTTVDQSTWAFRLGAPPRTAAPTCPRCRRS
ncbi:hypothetical protein [Fodinicola feengrottensis]|uniref:hypothetical protein n=1 Tax=Fodinicola feengrottensis TaxID=435914 RepID=UPI0013D26CEF|nr:hypothetical protein [Fodinicola feengrottensis]